MPALKSLFYAAALLITYSLLFYFIVNQQLNVDFPGFYGSAQAYLEGTNPYDELHASFLLAPVQIAINLNPPVFLLLFSPLTYFTYTTASIIWGLSSLILGSLGALICFYLTSTREFFKNNCLLFIMLYLALYSTLMNTSYNQIAGFLLFFIMAGYYFYLQKKEYAASFCWGLIIALKLFPALLFIFVLSQKQYKVFLLTFISALILWLLPLFNSGIELYALYFKMLSNLTWYGNSWNASIYGFLFRMFVDIDTQQNLLFLKITYLLISILLFCWYLAQLHKINRLKITHAAFSLTLMMMLLMSPFGWMYYFSLLILPLIVIYQALSQSTANKTGLWVFCLLLLSIPIENMQSRYIVSFSLKMTVYSLYFYGLITLIYLFFYAIKTNPQIQAMKQTADTRYTTPLKLILCMDVYIILCTLIVHLYK